MRQLSQEWIVLLVKIAVILQGVRLDHWRLSKALTLCQNKLRKPLAAADWCRRKTNGFGSGHNFLVKVIKDITPVKAFSKCCRVTQLGGFLLECEVKILLRHLSFFLSEVPVDLLLILVLGFR